MTWARSKSFNGYQLDRSGSQETRGSPWLPVPRYGVNFVIVADRQWILLAFVVVCLVSGAGTGFQSDGFVALVD
jgi:hypothetical protein